MILVAQAWDLSDASLIHVSTTVVHAAIYHHDRRAVVVVRRIDRLRIVIVVGAVLLRLVV